MPDLGTCGDGSLGPHDVHGKYARKSASSRAELTSKQPIEFVVPDDLLEKARKCLRSHPKLTYCPLDQEVCVVTKAQPPPGGRDRGLRPIFTYTSKEWNPTQTKSSRLTASPISSGASRHSRPSSRSLKLGRFQKTLSSFWEISTCHPKTPLQVTGLVWLSRLAAIPFSCLLFTG